MATKRLIALAHEMGKRVHVLHVTSKEEAVFLADHKDVASAEATPAHLTLAAPDCYERLGTLAQLNPPIRDATHRDALWLGLAQGVIDSIGSDHSPHTRAEKAVAYPKSHSGMPGVQTLVPIMLDHVNAGRLSLLRLVDLTSAGPARLFGIAATGRIALGYDADVGGSAYHPGAGRAGAFPGNFARLGTLLGRPVLVIRPVFLSPELSPGISHNFGL
jgi:dihydroorotase